MNISVISRNDCAWCDRVKERLKFHNLEYKEFNISNDPIMKDFLLSSGFTTVPQVFINGKHIGGYQETKVELIKQAWLTKEFKND